MPPLCLSSENPHYFEFDGKPLLLITSAEHYGMAINPDFDYEVYLDELHRCGCNQSRVFSGFHVENPTSFGIQRNTLAPKGERLLCPYARSDAPGYALGGNKFDLGRWDDAYWSRLKAIVARAAERGVMIEYVLFCMVYGPDIWAASPLNPRNNTSGLADVDHREVYDPRHADLRKVMDAMAEKALVELNGFDNLYYEIGNEVYDHPGNRDFLEHMAGHMRRVESRLPKRHLIALNVENRRKRHAHPIPGVDVLNFHYADPEAVGENYRLDKPIVDDETGFKGPDLEPYRREAWRFLLAGGAGISHLDYSFTVDRPDGTDPVSPKTPGTGGPAWRAQLKVLRDFMNAMEFWRMEPRADLLKTMHVPKAVDVEILANPGVEYAVYLHGRGDNFAPAIALGDQDYHATWIDPASGETLKAETVLARGWATTLAPPDYTVDLAVRLKATR